MSLYIRYIYKVNAILLMKYNSNLFFLRYNYFELAEIFLVIESLFRINNTIKHENNKPIPPMKVYVPPKLIELSILSKQETNIALIPQRKRLFKAVAPPEISGNISTKTVAVILSGNIQKNVIKKLITRITGTFITC